MSLNQRILGTQVCRLPPLPGHLLLLLMKFVVIMNCSPTLCQLEDAVVIYICALDILEAEKITQLWQDNIFPVM